MKKSFITFLLLGLGILLLSNSNIYVCTDSKNARIDRVTFFSVNDFIHHKMTKAEAEEYNHSGHEGNEYNLTAKEGDFVLLLGMHVATRETPRWTWQSFFWSPNPDNPVFPSSKAMADGRKTVKRKLFS